MTEMMRNKRKKKGFTLIELIVVIAILGILAAIAVPKLGGFQENARIRADEASAAAIGKAAEMYIASNNLTSVPTYATLPVELVAQGITFKSTKYAGAPTLGGTTGAVTVTGNSKQVYPVTP